MTPQMLAVYLGGLATLIGAVGSLIATLRGNTAQAISQAKNAADLNAIHILVNSRLTQALEEIKSLKEQLAAYRAGQP